MRETTQLSRRFSNFIRRWKTVTACSTSTGSGHKLSLTNLGDRKRFPQSSLWLRRFCNVRVTILSRCTQNLSGRFWLPFVGLSKSSRFSSARNAGVNTQGWEQAGSMMLSRSCAPSVVRFISSHFTTKRRCRLALAEGNSDHKFLILARLAGAKTSAGRETSHLTNISKVTNSSAALALNF